jgi:hypothetical protein
MPFGVKADSNGQTVDFDDVYQRAISAGVRDAGMEPIRADEELDGGIIHKPMFERLVLCDFAVADLTLANANVFYELGVRHAVRPHTTVLLFREGGQRLPFDLAPMRAIPYEVDAAGKIQNPERLAPAIAARLVQAREPSPDSPLYQLLDEFGPPDISRLKTDVFRKRVRYNEDAKDRLRRARATDSTAAVAEIHEDLRPIANQEAAVTIDLLLSYRAVGAFDAMVDLVREMPTAVASSVLVREQYAFALNRVGQDVEATSVLLDVLKRHGPSSETLGLLGRIYKDRWTQAVKSGSAAASGYLQMAIDTYRRGFEADWRDAYPGVNAVTLLELQEPGQQPIGELLPVVEYSARRRLQQAGEDYWDHATLLELAIIARRTDADRLLGATLAQGPEPWMRRSTAGNLRLISQARERAGEDVAVLQAMIAELDK